MPLISMSGLSPPWHPAGHPISIFLHCRSGHRQLSPLPRKQSSPTAQSRTAQSIIATFHSHLVAGQHAHQVLRAWASYTRQARCKRQAKGQIKGMHASERGSLSSPHGSLESLQVVADHLRSVRLKWAAMCSWRWFVRLQASERLAHQHARLRLLSRVWEVRPQGYGAALCHNIVGISVQASDNVSADLSVNVGSGRCYRVCCIPQEIKSSPPS
jgi:hypothetical protein